MEALVRSMRIEWDRVETPGAYPFHLPAVRAVKELDFHPQVTFLIGENGSGKSTLIEAIAVAAGYNAEGGTKNFAFGTRASESDLCRYVRLVKGTQRVRDGFFLRAESLFNVATEIERLDSEPAPAPLAIDSYGGVSLHEQSHGEAFLAVIQNRLGGQGFYVLDEPEAALSPQRQLVLLAEMHRLATKKGAQFVIATHSPILMAYPHATIYELGESGTNAVAYEDTEHYRLTRSFLMDPGRYFRHLFADDDDEPNSDPIDSE